MYDCMITLRSVTPAQRGEGLLKRAGIGCLLRRTPRRMEQQGCGYSLHLAKNNAFHATHLLRENKVSFRKLYFLGENGAMEEMLL